MKKKRMSMEMEQFCFRKTVREKIYSKEIIQKKEKGITLVSLVITIVILIILSIVVINVVIGKEGLIDQAKLAKDLATNSSIVEAENMNKLYDELSNILGNYESGMEQKIKIVERNEDNIKVRIEDSGLSNYQFSLDGINWSEKQQSNEFVFTNLEKVIVEDSKEGEYVENKQGKEYTIFAKAEDNNGKTIEIGPVTARTQVEIVTEEQNIGTMYEYADLGNEIAITGIGQPCYWANNQEWSDKELIEKIANKPFAIPSYINGKPVTKICDDAFKNLDNAYPIYQMAADANLWVFNEDGSLVLKYRYDNVDLSRPPRFALKPGNYEAYVVAGNAIAKQNITVNNTTQIHRFYMYVKMTVNDIIIPPTVKEFISREDLNKEIYLKEKNKGKVAQTSNSEIKSEQNNVEFHIETLESEIGPHSDKTITFFGKNSFNEIKNGDKFKQWADEYTSEVKFIE